MIQASIQDIVISIFGICFASRVTTVLNFFYYLSSVGIKYLTKLEKNINLKFKYSKSSLQNDSNFALIIVSERYQGALRVHFGHT